MNRKTLLVAIATGSLVLTASSSMAQNEYKIEITPFFGYSFSDGINVNAVDIGGDREVNKVTPRSGADYGFNFDLLVTENIGLGFEFAEQSSSLEGNIVGGGKQTFTDMKVRNYHGTFTYNLGDPDEKLRPYFLGGLGATQYSPSDIEGQSVGGDTRFSSTWGGGVKYFATNNVGLRFGARWTPTYINSEASGLWCSPWYPWNCWVVGSPNYSNQFELTGGVTLRF